MSSPPRLQQLVEAERRRAPAAGVAAREFARLSQALAAGATPLALGSSQAPLGASTLVGKACVALLVGASSGAAVLGGWQLLQPPAPREVARSQPPRLASPIAASPRPEAVREQRARSASPSSIAPARPAARRAYSAPMNAADGSTLKAELELLRAAQASLDAGDAASANASLEQHALRFPGGVLGLEREALRVLSRCASDPVGALPLARAFIRDHKASPLIDRVRRACRLEDPK